MEIRLFNSILEIGQEKWVLLESPQFPFADYAFLSSLEESASLGQRTGWEPLYFAGYVEGQLEFIFISFIKTNSYGEYIFDFAWAQAFESLGLDYYPKLVSAIPFSPVTGSKLLQRSDSNTPELRHEFQVKVFEKIKSELGPKLQLSSYHLLFPTEVEIPDYQRLGLFKRESFQYHFENPGFLDFEDFLSKLKSKRRKEIRRERQQVQNQNLKISQKTGDALTSREAIAMANFYADTTAKMGGYAYLTPAFFRLLFDRLRDKILFVAAEDETGRYVAGAMNVIGSETLFGRHWGCLEDYRSLHFELCYYQGIDFTLRHKLSLFEAGAQGEHKFQRGFLPKVTYSMHWVPHENLSLAIQDFCQRESLGIQSLFDSYSEHNPFSLGGQG